MNYQKRMEEKNTTFYCLEDDIKRNEEFHWNINNDIETCYSNPHFYGYGDKSFDIDNTFSYYITKLIENYNKNNDDNNDKATNKNICKYSNSLVQNNKNYIYEPHPPKEKCNSFNINENHKLQDYQKTKTSFIRHHNFATAVRNGSNDNQCEIYKTEENSKEKVGNIEINENEEDEETDDDDTINIFFNNLNDPEKRKSIKNFIISFDSDNSSISSSSEKSEYHDTKNINEQYYYNDYINISYFNWSNENVSEFIKYCKNEILELDQSNGSLNNKMGKDRWMIFCYPSIFKYELDHLYRTSCKKIEIIGIADSNCLSYDNSINGLLKYLSEQKDNINSNHILKNYINQHPNLISSSLKDNSYFQYFAIFYSSEPDDNEEIYEENKLDYNYEYYEIKKLLRLDINSDEEENSNDDKSSTNMILSCPISTPNSLVLPPLSELKGNEIDKESDNKSQNNTNNLLSSSLQQFEDEIFYDIWKKVRIYILINSLKQNNLPSQYSRIYILNYESDGSNEIYLSEHPSRSQVKELKSSNSDKNIIDNTDGKSDILKIEKIYSLESDESSMLSIVPKRTRVIIKKILYKLSEKRPTNHCYYIIYKIFFKYLARLRIKYKYISRGNFKKLKIRKKPIRNKWSIKGFNKNEIKYYYTFNYFSQNIQRQGLSKNPINILRTVSNKGNKNLLLNPFIPYYSYPVFRNSNLFNINHNSKSISYYSTNNSFSIPHGKNISYNIRPIQMNYSKNNINNHQIVTSTKTIPINQNLKYPSNIQNQIYYSYLSTSLSPKTSTIKCMVKIKNNQQRNNQQVILPPIMNITNYNKINKSIFDVKKMQYISNNNDTLPPIKKF
ncbi:hypothetical protein BCR32DRAFT_264613 [Anaeromyces robustus]|uniref:Uncharacterized protein n=1 Tax=Anaeromyces robustus TaxID=1754192 RepID=A0A1Y1XMP2_9FUNG|nr:hypothetical protein BCR32DRAFT_264613 [Anaeromyces robustus]|eukprot:ORX86998.1 hypothetical protein BCR32DRAFT_264613 [Anaeromyces robustus]